MDYLNPFSEKFILKGIINAIATLLDYLNPFSENFILKTLFTWIGDFFNALFDFVYHIFIPTDEQWEAIKQDYSELGETFNNHIPFIGFFNNELENAKQIVHNEDFLNIKFASWSFDLGVVEFSTPEINFTGVLNAYEPYRIPIRSLLVFIVYCLVIVYIIKYVLKYGTTDGNSKVVDTQSSYSDKGGK